MLYPMFISSFLREENHEIGYYCIIIQFRIMTVILYAIIIIIMIIIIMVRSNHYYVKLTEITKHKC